MKIGNKIKNFIYLKRNFFIILIFSVIWTIVSSYDYKIKNFFGFPDVTKLIDNRKSYLLDYLIDYKDFNNDWNILTVLVLQSDKTSHYVKQYFDGKYLQDDFDFVQYIYANSSKVNCIELMNHKIEGRYDNLEKYNYQEIYLDIGHPLNEINTYCYHMNRIDNEEPSRTSCSLFRVDSTVMVDLEITLNDKLSTEEAIQMTDDLKSMVVNTER